MTLKTNKKIKTILENIVDGYTLGKKYNYCLEYSVKGLIRGVDINESELGLILDGFEEKNIIDKFVESGNDSVIKEETYTIYFPDDFLSKSENYIKKLSENEIKTDNSGLILYLDKDGNFWHGEKEKGFCYPMDVTSNRFKIIKYLIKNKGFQSPKEMLPHLNTKTTTTLRSEISKIKKNVTKFLMINGDDVIDSKNDSGYRINPKCRIFFVEN